MAQYKLGFIGGGAMAGAIISAIVEKGLYNGNEILVYDHNAHKLDDLRKKYEIVASCSDNEVLSLCDKVIIAIKPQHFKTLEVSVKKNDPIIISIMAGVSIKKIEEKFPKSAIARVMPNMPAQVHEGMSGICGNGKISSEDMKEVVKIFEHCGKAIVIDEEKMDVVCGLSGSGPAYMFMIIEALADGAVMMGLGRADAYKLVAQTMLGSAKMVLEEGRNPSVLKDMVTSPGGTTIKGVYALEEGSIRSALMKAVEQATLRSKELGE